MGAMCGSEPHASLRTIVFVNCVTAWTRVTSDVIVTNHCGTARNVSRSLYRIHYSTQYYGHWVRSTPGGAAYELVETAVGLSFLCRGQRAAAFSVFFSMVSSEGTPMQLTTSVNSTVKIRARHYCASSALQCSVVVTGYI